MKKYVNLGMAAAIILAFIFGIYQKEQLIAKGDVIYLALAPVDPRSIMQGDYMRLAYELEVKNRYKLSRDSDKSSRMLILSVDAKKVAEYGGLYAGQELLENQILFKYQIGSRTSTIDIAPDSFLFQQGLRTLYAAAKYGIFKVTDNEHLLVGLADGDLKEIEPPAPKTN